MIAFDRLWQTMRKRNISQYKLIKTYGISTGQLDQLCSILQCGLEDIAEHVEDKENKKE